jgi:hypothetical protein
MGRFHHFIDDNKSDIALVIFWEIVGFAVLVYCVSYFWSAP